MKLGRAGSAMAAAAVLSLLLPVSGCAPSHKFYGEVVEPARPAPELTGVNWDA